MTTKRILPAHRVKPHAPRWGEVMDRYVQEMRIANYSEATIDARVELLRRFEATVNGSIFEATAEDIRRWQTSVAHLSSATTNVYARHLKVFFTWAAKQGYVDPALLDVIVVPRVRRGRPHPTATEDIRVILACATGPLRMAYILAAFAGLRCGEICRLARADLTLPTANPTALIHGKGGKERVVPLLAPVVDELTKLGRVRWVIDNNGLPWSPDRLSIVSSEFLHGLGIETTLHSMRHAFATAVVAATRDPMLVRDLLGHESVATSEIYMLSSLEGAHDRMAAVSDTAASLLSPRRLRVVGS